MSRLDGYLPHRLRTLGALELTARDGTPVPAHRRELLLLAYLAARPRQADTRIALATLLWEDRDDRRARASLRQAIFRLQGALPGVLVLDGETVALAAGRLRTDAGELVRLAADGVLDEAIACWGGDFLAGEDPPEGSALREWAATERERLRVVYARVLERRMAQAESAATWLEAVTVAERLAELATREADSARAALRRTARTPVDAPAGEAPPAGLEAERARLLAAWRHVADGADPVLLTGAAASGRSRLLTELQEVARAEGAIVHSAAWGSRRRRSCATRSSAPCRPRSATRRRGLADRRGGVVGPAAARLAGHARRRHGAATLPRAHRRRRRRSRRRDAPRAHAGCQLARAYLVLAGRDTAAALAQLRQLTWRDCPTECLANDLHRARLFVAVGAVDEARALLSGGSPADWRLPPTALDVLWLLERARLAERADDRARAASAYRSVVGFWTSADPALQPLVAEARAGLRRTERPAR